MSAAAPTLPEGLAASPSVAIAGSDVFLPTSARVDLAYEYHYVFEASTSQYAGFSQLVPGDYLEILLAVYCVVDTDSNAGNRVVQLFVTAPSSNTTYVFAAPAAQPATTIWQYVWLAGGALGGSSAAAFFFVPLPPLALSSGYTWGASVQEGSHVGDNMAAINATTLRIPTGPGATRPALTPTPLLT